MRSGCGFDVVIEVERNGVGFREHTWKLIKQSHAELLPRILVEMVMGDERGESMSKSWVFI